MNLSLPELERAINYWRSLRPSKGEERALSAEVNALAQLYALMIFDHSDAVAIESLDQNLRQLIESAHR